jgi:L-amino acid N-acyltransferase YncA
MKATVDVEIEQMQPNNWSAVKAIYEAGIATGNATFQTEAPSWDEWNSAHLQHSRIVAMLYNEVVGWAALSPVSGRCVYGGVAEVSVYISTEVRGKGVGKTLLNELIQSSEANGIWTLQAGIFPENVASMHLHESAGFRVVGYREKIGKHFGVWRDTVLLERRSNAIQ